jgi:phosphoglucosamine mutase
MSETLMRKYFGTDGIRGVANEQLTADLAMAAGRAAVAALGSARPRILIGRDTRVSGPMLEAALVAGISSAGGEPVLAGIIPTPAVAALILSEGLDAGAVISASHNPYRDNGIKFFGPSGFKLTDAQEAEIEEIISRGTESGEQPPEPGAVTELENAVSKYVDGLVAAFDMDLSGIKVLIDCANGATYESSPAALLRLGARVSVICDRPDGRNINDGCGSTHVETLRERVRGDGFDLGLAFDGDGDRVICVDHEGEVVDGDFVMAICARHLHEAGALAKDTIVTTVMTNLGFMQAMSKFGIKVKMTAVGDRYVLEEMLAGGYEFGGEQSGHIINLKTGTTGDGLATALMLLQVMKESGASLSDLAGVMTRLPQKLINVKVAEPGRLDDAREVWDAVEEEASRLGDSGRVLLRPSGTEPVVRVMVEAETAEECDAVAERLAAIVKGALG